MAELFAINDNYDNVDTHVIFVHGLGGDIYKTWTMSGTSSHFWPAWLSDDHDVGVWLLGYDAAASNWLGHSMHLPDRGENILSSLLVEERLRRGCIIFVTHSLGGLVVKQVLRAAEREANVRRDAEGFLTRVKRVAFIGTPHFGSRLATLSRLLKSFARRSNAMVDLESNNPNLRDLNNWYRRFSSINNLEHLVLIETQPVKILGVVVPPDSADPGVEVIATPIDANHINIVKPTSRGSLVYRLISDFVKKKISNEHFNTQIAAEVKNNTFAVAGMAEAIDTNTEVLKVVEKSLNSLAMGQAGSSENPEILDEAAHSRLNDIVKRRFYSEYDLIGNTKRLAENLLSGGLKSCSTRAKMEGLAWCARLIYKFDKSLSIEFLTHAKSFGECELTTIVEAIFISDDGRLDEALGKLSLLNSIESKTTAFILICNENGVDAGLLWLDTVGGDIQSIGVNARFVIIIKYLERRSWSEMLEIAKKITPKDFHDVPVLYQLSAQAHLLPGVPDEFKVSILQNSPFHATDFPLSIEKSAVESRKESIKLYREAAQIARELSLPRAEQQASDMALWLALNDTEMKFQAIEQLNLDMNNPGVALRRLSFALELGLDVDLAAVEKLIDQQSALSGGMSEDAAIGRFAMAYTKGSHREIANYIKQHKNQLNKALNPIAINLILVETLSRTGEISEAEALLSELKTAGATQFEINRASRIISESKGLDPVQERLRVFTESNTLPDLKQLVDILEKKQAWLQLEPYITELFDRTYDLNIGKLYIHVLYELDLLGRLLTALDKNPELSRATPLMKEYRCRAYFELGRFEEARQVLTDLKRETDSEELRSLEVAILRSSGDWDSLHVVIEKDWDERGERSARDLVRSANLAAMIHSPRVKDLTVAAADLGSTDPHILISCYNIATGNGWEDVLESHKWLETAARLSGEDGPVKTMSLESLIEQSPNWDKKTEDLWKKLKSGQVPMFAVAKLSNTPFLNMLLHPLFSNPVQPDVRKRTAIYSFHGGSHIGVESICKDILLDVSSLITAEVVGIGDDLYRGFESVSVTHDVLSWLFEERQRIVYHQPSRVDGARALRDLLANKDLVQLDFSEPPSPDLVNVVGEDLASMIEVARRATEQTGAQHLIVHPLPVHRPGSLMLSPVDLSENEVFFCSCMPVIARLAKRGLLTEDEVQACEIYLSPRTRVESQSTVINDNATIYLDDVVVTFFQHLKILPKLRRAGITTYVSSRIVGETNVLLEFEKFSELAGDLIEKVRIRARDEIQSGRLKVQPLLRKKRAADSGEELKHPTMTIFEGSAPGLIAIDDRYFNGNNFVSDAEISTRLISTLGILQVLESKNTVSKSRVWGAYTTLRRGGAVLVPVSEQELGSYLEKAQVTDMILVESAELKAIKENIAQIKIFGLLQFPSEMPWFVNLCVTCISCIKELWCKEGVEAAAVKSAWVFKLIDPRTWGDAFGQVGAFPHDRLRAQTLTLASIANQLPASNIEAYLQWLEDDILTDLSKLNKPIYDELINDIGELIISFYQKKPGGNI